jgi:hypothetical protein
MVNLVQEYLKKGGKSARNRKEKKRLWEARRILKFLTINPYKM